MGKAGSTIGGALGGVAGGVGGFFLGGPVGAAGGAAAGAGLGSSLGDTLEGSDAHNVNTSEYDEERRIARERGGDLFSQGNGYRQTAPTIANVYQDQSRASIWDNTGRQKALAGELAANRGEASKAQFQSQLDRSITAGTALANSARGGASQTAGALRNAQHEGAIMSAQGAATTAELGARERLAAQGLAGSIYGNVGNQLGAQYGLEQQSAIEQARLASANQAQANAMRLGLYGAGNAAEANAIAAMGGATNAQAVANAQAQAEQAQRNQLAGSLVNAGGTMLAAGARGKGAASGGGGGNPTGYGVPGGSNPSNSPGDGYYDSSSGIWVSGPPGRADGGPVEAGRPYVVGERGPEIVVPKRDGQVVTAEKSAPTLAAALAGVKKLEARVKELEGGGAEAAPEGAVRFAATRPGAPWDRSTTSPTAAQGRVFVEPEQPPAVLLAPPPAEPATEEPSWTERVAPAAGEAFDAVASPAMYLAEGGYRGYDAARGAASRTVEAAAPYVNSARSRIASWIAPDEPMTIASLDRGRR